MRKNVFCPYITGIQNVRKNNTGFGPWFHFKKCENRIWECSIMVINDYKFQSIFNDDVKITNYYIYTVCEKQCHIMTWTAQQQPFDYLVHFSILDSNFSEKKVYDSTAKPYMRLESLDPRPPQNFFGSVSSTRIPGHQSTLNMVFFSCNGLSHATGYKITKPEKHKKPDVMWNQLTAYHLQDPIHLMIGGGDQIYNDEMWYHVPCLEKFMKLSRNEMIEYVLDKDEIIEIRNFIFNYYCFHFSRHFMKLIYHQVPFINVADDHDYFDGFGSYPSDLQQCPVFKMVGEITHLFFCLFQLHRVNTHLSEAFVCPIAPRLTLVGFDTRTQRTPNQVLPSNTLEKTLPEKLDQCSQTTVSVPFNTLLVLFPIPLYYPNISWAPHLLRFLHKCLYHKYTPKFLRKLISSKIGVVFNEIDLLDDAMDQMDSYNHRWERDQILKFFFQQRKEQVNFLCGDVHIPSLAYISEPETGRKFNQITSSAIANAPPSNTFIHIMDYFRHNPKPEGLEMKFKRFKYNKKRFLRQRNFCLLQYMPEGQLKAFLMTEKRGKLVLKIND